MEQLAVGYLGISHETVRNLRDDDPADFTREILRLFRNKKPGNDITVSICFFNDLHYFSRIRVGIYLTINVDSLMLLLLRQPIIVGKFET